MTKYHRLTGWLTSNKNLSLILLEAGSLRWGCRHAQVLAKGHFWIADFLLCPPMLEGDRELSGTSFIKHWSHSWGWLTEELIPITIWKIPMINQLLDLAPTGWGRRILIKTTEKKITWIGLQGETTKGVVHSCIQDTGNGREATRD